MKRAIALLLLLSLPGAARAETACEHPHDDFDGLYCLNKVFEQADHELNDTYGKLSARLGADGRARLKSGQLAWIGQRNDKCSRREGQDFYVNLSCATRTTIDRTHFLEDRLRECNASGCQLSRLDAAE